LRAAWNKKGEVTELTTKATKVALPSLYLPSPGKFIMVEKSKNKNRKEIPLKLVPLICADCGCDLGRSPADQIFLLREKVYCRGCKANYLHAKSLEDLTVN
jgi:hypothetical protein